MEVLQHPQARRVSRVPRLVLRNTDLELQRVRAELNAAIANDAYWTQQGWRILDSQQTGFTNRTRPTSYCAHPHQSLHTESVCFGTNNFLVTYQIPFL